MLGDALLRVARQPVHELSQMAGPMTRAVLGGEGIPVRKRARNVAQILSLVRQIGADASDESSDPLQKARAILANKDDKRLETLEQEVVQEVSRIVKRALAPAEEAK